MNFALGSRPNTGTNPTVMPGLPPIANSIGVTGGNGFVYTNIPNGTIVGPSGTGPCIGVTVVSPPDTNGNITVWVFHFQGTDNPGATLNNVTFPPGSTVILNGGQNADPNSMGTLQSVYTYFQGNPNTTIGGYYNNPSFYVDNLGNYYAYLPPNYAIEDPTLPHP